MEANVTVLKPWMQAQNHTWVNFALWHGAESGWNIHWPRPETCWVLPFRQCPSIAFRLCVALTFSSNSTKASEKGHGLTNHHESKLLQMLSSSYLLWNILNGSYIKLMVLSIQFFLDDEQLLVRNDDSIHLVTFVPQNESLAKNRRFFLLRSRKSIKFSVIVGL